MLAGLLSRRSVPVVEPPVEPAVPPPATDCTSVFVHGCGVFKIRYACTLPAPHDGQLHEHRPRPGRMSVAEWS